MAVNADAAAAVPELQRQHPGWHVWASSNGHLYATARDKSALLPGAARTVDAATPADLSAAVGEAERDASLAAAARERRDAYQSVSK